MIAGIGRSALALPVVLILSAGLAAPTANADNKRLNSAVVSAV